MDQQVFTRTSPLDGSDQSGGPRLVFRLIYRDPQGHMHLDWPVERIHEALREKAGTLWVDIDDPGSEAAAVEAFLEHAFGFHPLAVEDALRETHLPKVDDWNDYLYLVFNTITMNGSPEAIEFHELDLFLGDNYLVTYHFEPIVVLRQLGRLIERDGGRRMAQGADQLLYHLLDLIAADHLPLIEVFDDAIDQVQDDAIVGRRAGTVGRIMDIKRSLSRLVRMLHPQREVLNRLARDEYGQVRPQHRVYFRDVYDHLVRMTDTCELERDLIAGVLDTYLSSVSNRTNEVMKTLTMVTVLFLPLNFVVGFFGMNFFGENIALNHVRPAHTVLFVLICVSMLAAPWAMYAWARWRRWF